MKRRTKSDREGAEKAALRQRLVDLAQGALGWCELNQAPDEDWLLNSMGLDDFGRFLGAVQRTFGADGKKLVEPYMVHHYDRINTARDYLFERGVRP